MIKFMKNKKIILGLCGLLLISIFATGCKQEIEVKDGSKVAVKIDGGKITATDYYNKIKQNNVSVLIDMIDRKLLEKKYPETDEENDQVEGQIKQLKDNYKDEETLNIYMNHIKNILIQSYINYHDSTKKMPTKLYRSISKYEFDYLKTTRKINTLWSTTSSLKTAIGYTIEMSRLEWNPEEHFILEFSPREKIPFVDVDTDAETIFEPNEFILIPPFNI